MALRVEAPRALAADGAGSIRRMLVAVGLAVLAGVPPLLLRVGVLDVSVEVATLLFGVGVIGAAFAMSWGAEAAQHDVPQALALVVVAVLAVLPEYAVDLVFAWKAGQDPSFTAYAAANMTGSNRLLLGLGWPTISMIAWLTRRERILRLDRSTLPALACLGAATLYSFLLPVKATISLVDSALLIALFAGYAVLSARAEVTEPELVGPAATIGRFSPRRRQLTVIGLFLFAAATIAISAEPFAEGLVQTGHRLGIDEFLLVQWLAPLASELPEFLVAVLLAVRGNTMAALALLLSSKVNQWTLLIGSLPIAYSVGAGRLAALPLDARQVGEVLLTAAQSLFGLAVLASLSFGLLEAVFLAALFVAQLAIGGALRTSAHEGSAATLELFAFSGLYLVLAACWLVSARRTLKTLVYPHARLRRRPRSSRR